MQATENRQTYCCNDAIHRVPKNIKTKPMQEERIATLKRIITPYVQNKEALEQLTAETDFIKDLEINSAHLVDIILDVEDEFDIEIEDEAMEEMLTVKAALDVISAKVDA